MNQSKFQVLFAALPTADQARLLAAVSANLTVSARSTDTSQIGQEKALSRLFALNELQQAITTQIVPLMTNDDKRYPSDVFVKILFEVARNRKVETDLEWALGLACRSFGEALART